MRILKSIGLVVVGGLYVFLIANMSRSALAWLLSFVGAFALFCWGYFFLFEPKGGD